MLVGKTNYLAKIKEYNPNQTKIDKNEHFEQNCTNVSGKKQTIQQKSKQSNSTHTIIDSNELVKQA